MILANFNLGTSSDDYIITGESIEEVMEKANKNLDAADYNFDEIQWYEVSREFKVIMTPVYTKA